MLDTASHTVVIRPANHLLMCTQTSSAAFLFTPSIADLIKDWRNAQLSFRFYILPLITMHLHTQKSCNTKHNAAEILFCSWGNKPKTKPKEKETNQPPHQKPKETNHKTNPQSTLRNASEAQASLLHGHITHKPSHHGVLVNAPTGAAMKHRAASLCKNLPVKPTERSVGFGLSCTGLPF